MCTNKILSLATALLALHPVLAVPVADNAPAVILPRNGTTVVVDPPKDPKPDITVIPEMTEQELQQLLQGLKKGGSLLKSRTYSIEELAARNEQLEPRDTSLLRRQNGQGTSTNGPFLSFIDGDILPGSGNPTCKDFLINGPFDYVHFFMGDNMRAVKATSYSGNSTEVQASTTSVEDAEYSFANNERITKFSIGRGSPSDKRVLGLKFQTDAGKSFELLSSTLSRPSSVTGVTPSWQDIPVGSGIIARLSGTSCQSGVFGSFGIDFLDQLSSIGISNLDYSGFTDNIMPAGDGSQISVGSQILDNRNTSVSQTITLQTTDAVTQSRTLTTALRAMVGGSIQIEGSAGIPIIGQTSITANANWQLERTTSDADMTGSITTRAATFALVCPAGKFCTANAFFMQYKLDVSINATLTATTTSGQTFSWIQSGSYSGADSLAMRFNVTEVDRIV